MIAYTPRPGSKTALAVEYLTAHGGAATAIDLAEALDTERKNLPASFLAAVEAGLLEPCDLPNGKGYRLRGDSKGATPAPVPPPAAPLAAVPTPSPSRPAAPAPKPAPRPPAQREKNPPVRYRIGEFSDGALRIEGAEPDIDMRLIGEDDGLSITLSPAVAIALREFLQRRSPT